MRTVAFVTQKGGSGKSTLSASLAVAAQDLRGMVMLIDMDPQGSLSTWARNRNDERLGVQAVTAGQLRAVMPELSGLGVSLAIIDTPAGDGAIAEAAMAAADLVLIPVRPTVFDIWACEATWRRARALGRECAFVINQCPITQSSRRIREGIAAIEAMGGLIQPVITSRVDYQDAMQRGLGPTEVNVTGEAAEEVRQLWASVRRRLALARFHAKAGRAAA